MKNLYLSTKELDHRCLEEFGLSEFMLMENAASKIETVIRKKLKTKSRILAVCGGGNNGADAICALRKLSGDYDCCVYMVDEKQNLMNSCQQRIAQNLGVKFIRKIIDCDCVVDGIFGSGLNKELDDNIIKIIDKLNDMKCLKIAVDVPTGVDKFGKIINTAFISDITVTMGARKLCLYSDVAKDYIGKVVVANLGICNDKFEQPTDRFLLEKEDMKLPYRKKQNTNKGNFGHTYVISGQMSGAAQIAALAANAIGSGLVSIVSKEKLLNLNPTIMQKNGFENANTVVAGCGLGDQDINFADFENKNCVFDADLCYKKEIIPLLETNENIVITPHPKEFTSLLSLADIADKNVDEVQNLRFELSRVWSKKFPGVLVLKGANTIIAQDGNIYIMPFGKSILSKGGSGDVLAGIIGGLLAQSYTPIKAAITGTLAHAFAAAKFRKNSYSLNPLDIIEGLKCL